MLKSGLSFRDLGDVIGFLRGSGEDIKSLLSKMRIKRENCSDFQYTEGLGILGGLFIFGGYDSSSGHRIVYEVCPINHISLLRDGIVLSGIWKN